MADHELSTPNAPRRGLAPDPGRFFIPVELDRERVLCFDNTAAFRIYQRYGGGFWRELFEYDPDDTNPDKKKRRLRLRSQEAFEFFLWVGLQRDAEVAGETLSLEQVREMVYPWCIADLVGALVVALTATRTRPEKAAPGNAPAGDAGAPIVN